MKKIIAATLFAAVSTLVFADESSHPVLSESVSDGKTINTRSLASNGLLTESSCTVPLKSSPELQHCVSRHILLSEEAREKYAAEMSQAFTSANAQQYSQESKSLKKGQSHGLRSRQSAGMMMKNTRTKGESGTNSTSAGHMQSVGSSVTSLNGSAIKAGVSTY